MLPSLLLGSERHKSFALPFDCDAVSAFNGICQKVGRKEPLEHVAAGGGAVQGVGGVRWDGGVGPWLTDDRQ